MNFSIIFVIFSLFSILNSSQISKFVDKILIDEQKLPKSICKIINDITSSRSDTQDILIGNLGSKSQSSTINDIAKCIRERTAVVVSDFKDIVTNEQLRKASVVILEINQINEYLIDIYVSNQQNSTIWHHMAKFICIVPASSTLKQRVHIINEFMTYGSLNVAVVYTNLAADIIYETVSASFFLNVHKNPSNGLSLFPDKLKDLKGLNSTVAIHDQQPSVVANQHFVRGQMFYFLEAISKAMNIKFKLHVLPNYSYLIEYRKKRKMHLTLNTILIFDTNDPKLFTYEINGYCALVPILPKMALYYQIFILPFDALTWLLFGVSVVSSIVVWRMFRGRGAVDSHWNLAVGIFTMFIGQGADFSRHNRFVLAVLLNIICMSVFLLNNLYESTITSSMINPANGNHLKTVEDLLASNYEIVTDQRFTDKAMSLKEFQRLIPRIIVRPVNLPKTFNDEVVSQRYTYIFRCDMADLGMRSKFPDGRRFTDFYYKLPEVIFWNYVELEASFLNPLIERFQYYMDLSFQAGLHHMWKVFEMQSESQLKKNLVNVEKVFLELKDFQTVFGIFLLMSGMSVAVFIAEIFYHDCLRNISLENLVNFVRKYCRKRKHYRRKILKLKTRKIVVQQQNSNI